MNGEYLSLDNYNSLNNLIYNSILNSKTPKNSFDLAIDRDININSKIRFEKVSNNKISSPFKAYSISTENNFNEEKIKEKLRDILPKKDHIFIDHIISDKKIFSNNLTYEKGVFRDKKGNLLEVFHGGREGFDVPLHILDAGAKNGLSMLSHNHTNGLVIPSSKDIQTVNLVKSKYNPIYSPNKTSLLVNNNVSKNKIIREEISNRYDKFLEDKKARIEKSHPDDTKTIRTNYVNKELEKRLSNLYKSYFIKNQGKIVKEVNNLFKENSFDLKLYIL